MQWAGAVRAAVGLVVALAALTVEAPAQAEAFNKYSISGLGPITIAKTSFTVLVSGTNPVCSMRFGKIERTTAPWTFTLDPAGTTRTVQVQLCGETWTQSVYLDTVVPWRLEPTILYRESLPKARAVLYISSDLDERAQVVITDPNGTTAGTGTVQPMTVSSIAFQATSTNPLTQYSVRISSETSRTTMSIPIFIANSWNGYSEEPSFPKCSTIPWFYDHAKAPRAVKAASIRKDITQALAILSKETGLTFVESAMRLPADSPLRLNFDWTYTGSEAAVGGYDSASSNDVETIIGRVQLNRRSWWLSSESYKGFALVKRPRTVPGRGWLFVHEVMHALGFAHTKDKSQIMYPIMSRQIALGDGDKAGLRYLYQPSTCTSS